MKRKDIRVVLFDVFGTVVDWRAGVARDVDAVLTRIGRSDIDAFAFADAWRRLYGPAMEEVRSGRRDFVKLDTLHRENLERALGSVGVPLTCFDHADLAYLTTAWHRLDPWPDAVEGLTRLRRHVAIAPLSNGNVSLLLAMARRAGLPWDAILGAEVVRAYKPMPEAYLRTVALLDLEPHQVCLAAAHESDLAAAAACGLCTAYVARPYEFGAFDSRRTAPSQQWDFAVPDLIELAHIFDGATRDESA